MGYSIKELSAFFEAYFGNFSYMPCKSSQCAVIKLVVPRDLGSELKLDLDRRLSPILTGMSTRIEIIEKMTVDDERVLYEFEIHPGTIHVNSRNGDVENFLSKLPREIKGFFERHGNYRHYIQKYGKKV